jgi:hypothetical protein
MLKLTKKESNKSIIKIDYYKEIKKAITKIFFKEYVRVDKKFCTITFPLGDFVEDDSKWMFDIECSKSDSEENDIQNQIILFYIIRDVVKFIPNLEFGMGHYLVFNNDNICAGVLFNENIYEYMKNNDIENYTIAKNILENKMILDYQDEIENIKKGK